MVCSNAGTLCRNQLECPDSFRPPGHCCDMCGNSLPVLFPITNFGYDFLEIFTSCAYLGAMMKVTFNERTFTKSSFDQLVSSMLVEDGWPASQSYSYRTEENILHMMIVDNTTNEKSVNIASKIYDYLNKGKDCQSILHQNICLKQQINIR